MFKNSQCISLWLQLSNPGKFDIHKRRLGTSFPEGVGLFLEYKKGSSNTKTDNFTQGTEIPTAYSPTKVIGNFSTGITLLQETSYPTALCKGVNAMNYRFKV